MSGSKLAGAGSRAISAGLKSVQNDFHMTACRTLPQAAQLKLPQNVEDINTSEVACFSPMRSRDITGSVIATQESWNTRKIDVTLETDPHIGPYDCRGVVSLSSSMQSNVPSPFSGGRQGYLGMPGSQWGQGQKFLSEYLHSAHYFNLRNTYGRAIHGTGRNSGIIISYHTHASLMTPVRTMCNDTKVTNENEKPPSRKEKLKQAVAAYGSTVIVFHVTISLASLGFFYMLVSSGLDVVAWIEYFGLTDSAFSKKIASNAGTFVVAYAVHKVFAPVRIGITLTATPFIVTYLRKIGILKAVKK